jgi:hypothetical protein
LPYRHNIVTRKLTSWVNRTGRPQGQIRPLDFEQFTELVYGPSIAKTISNLTPELQKFKSQLGLLKDIKFSEDAWLLFDPHSKGILESSIIKAK